MLASLAYLSHQSQLVRARDNLGSAPVLEFRVRRPAEFWPAEKKIPRWAAFTTV